MEDNTIEHLEHREHAEHAHHSADDFNQRVSVTIALLAVLAAGVGSLETLETGAAISAKNESVLIQAKASDQWAFFQSKSIKKNQYEIAAKSTPLWKDDFHSEAERYARESKDIQTEAKRLEELSKAHAEEGDHHEHRHHILTVAATLLHIAIAIATISIISKGARWPWFLSMGLSVAGAVTAAGAYLA